MKTFLTILTVWLGLSVFAMSIFITCAWWNSKADPDDAAEEDSKS